MQHVYPTVPSLDSGRRRRARPISVVAVVVLSEMPGEATRRHSVVQRGAAVRHHGDAVSVRLRTDTLNLLIRLRVVGAAGGDAASRVAGLR